jgi:hypothetical protein
MRTRMDRKSPFRPLAEKNNIAPRAFRQPAPSRGHDTRALSRCPGDSNDVQTMTIRCVLALLFDRNTSTKVVFTRRF